VFALRQHHASKVQACSPFDRLRAHDRYLLKRLRSSGGSSNSAIAFSRAA
jgi:hypothetical protein